VEPVSDRKRRGVWYTPLDLVEAVVAQAVYPGALTALDPACGDGRFLRATGLPSLTGVDIDPRSWVSTLTGEPETHEQAADAMFIHDDALRRDWGDQRFDVVVGNPPFLNQMATLTTRGGSSRWGGGPYADAAAEFLSLALHLTRPGGRFGLVLPQSLLSTRDAAAIRQRVDEQAALRWMWWTDTMMFDANVRVWAGVWEVGGSPGLVQRAAGPQFDWRSSVAMPSTWASLLLDDGQTTLADSASGAAVGNIGTLGDIATFAVDFRQHYYAVADALVDSDGDAVGELDGCPPLVNSGLIDPGECLWGRRPARVAKRSWNAPRVDLQRLSPSMRAWAQTRLVPKILIANQTKVIEAVHDADGAWLPGVPVITCLTNQPERVLTTLSSDRATRWVHAHAAGSGLGAGSVRLTPALLASIPLRSRTTDR